MKKLLLITICLFLISNLLYAEKGKFESFNHLDFSLALGTTGIDVDVSMPVGDLFKVRTGVAFMPHFKYKMHFGMQVGDGNQTTIDENGNPTTKFSRMSSLLKQAIGYDMKDDVVDVIGTPTMTQYKLLIDVTPFKNKNWQLTAGFYLGKSKIGKAYNTTYEMPTLVMVNMYNNIYDCLDSDQPLISYRGITIDCPDNIKRIILSYGRMGINMGEFKEDGNTYMLEPDNDCMVKASAYVNAFRPYLGFGYSGVPFQKAERLKLGCDCGLLFWGRRPDIVMHDGVSLSKDVTNVRGQVGDYLNIINKFPVYPVLNIKLTYNIF